MAHFNRRLAFQRSLIQRGANRAGVMPWFVTGLGLPLLAMALMWPDRTHQAETLVHGAWATIHPVFSLPLPFNPTQMSKLGLFSSGERESDESEAVTLKVQRGDSLARLFRREGLNISDLAELMKIEVAREYLRLLRPGDEIKVRYSAGSILGLEREIDLFRGLIIQRSGDQFQADVVPLQVESHQVEATGRITSSLFEAGAQAGISDNNIMRLAAIFASDIDFVLDLREGDAFSIVYDQVWRDGRKVADGDILAAEFVNQGVAYRAIRYSAADGHTGYFTPEGKSLRKAFVRAPVAFSRISSEFNPGRMHPILHTMRAHQGIDYAAPAGTPVHAPGDGAVIFKGWQSGYGNTLILQHAGQISTLYGHLSAFGRGIQVGSRVNQGEVIAYVGATGLATAPHLHYEYRVNGVHMNPRTVKLPNDEPLTASQLKDFQRTSQSLIRHLNSTERNLLSATDKAT